MITVKKCYKVGVKTVQAPYGVDRDWLYNDLRFSTLESAEKYAKDLTGRWTAVVDWTVTEVIDQTKVKALRQLARDLNEPVEDEDEEVYEPGTPYQGDLEDEPPVGEDGTR